MWGLGVIGSMTVSKTVGERSNRSVPVFPGWGSKKVQPWQSAAHNDSGVIQELSDWKEH